MNVANNAAINHNGARNLRDNDSYLVSTKRLVQLGRYLLRDLDTQKAWGVHVWRADGLMTRQRYAGSDANSGIRPK